MCENTVVDMLKCDLVADRETGKILYTSTVQSLESLTTDLFALLYMRIMAHHSVVTSMKPDNYSRTVIPRCLLRDTKFHDPQPFRALQRLHQRSI